MTEEYNFLKDIEADINKKFDNIDETITEIQNKERIDRVIEEEIYRERFYRNREFQFEREFRLDLLEEEQKFLLKDISKCMHYKNIHSIVCQCQRIFNVYYEPQVLSPISYKIDMFDPVYSERKQFIVYCPNCGRATAVVAEKIIAVI